MKFKYVYMKNSNKLPHTKIPGIQKINETKQAKEARISLQFITYICKEKLFPLKIRWFIK